MDRECAGQASADWVAWRCSGELWRLWSSDASLRGLGFDGLGDDADVGDACAFDRVHHRGEGAEGDALIGLDVDGAVGGVVCSCRCAAAR